MWLFVIPTTYTIPLYSYLTSTYTWLCCAALPPPPCPLPIPVSCLPTHMTYYIPTCMPTYSGRDPGCWKGGGWV